jgi:hypothetical protein
MKRFYQFLPLLILPLAFIFLAPSGGSPGGKSGSPGDNGNNCTQCHSGTPLNATDWITSDIPGNGYVGGETYIITASGEHPGVGKFGFELTAEDQSGNKVGTFTVINASETQITGNNTAVTHTSGGTAPSGDSKTWEVEWTAPEDIPGDVTFYAALNAANANGGTSGDVIYLTEKTYGPDVTGIGDVVAESDFYPNPTTGIVNFNVADGFGGDVKIYNQAGQLIERFNAASNGQVDLTSQAKGLYFVQFNNGQMQKLIVR